MVFCGGGVIEGWRGGMEETNDYACAQTSAFGLSIEKRKLVQYVSSVSQQLSLQPTTVVET